MTNLTESGEPIVIDECRRCGELNAHGVEFIRAGIRVFKCDACGRGMNNGYLEDAHKKQVEGRDGRAKATENRDRFWGEHQEKQAMEFKKRSNEPNAYPEEVWNIDYATRKWKF